MQGKLQQNQVYEIARKVASATSEEQKNDMLDELSEVLAKHFEEKSSTVIEDAIRTALNSSDLETSNIIMDEAYLEIESLCFEDGNTEFDSTMQIMPCTILTDNDNAVIPSINTFERIIRKHLLQEKIIEREDQFRLGTVFLNENDMATLKFQDWWNVHREIVEEDDSYKSESLSTRDQKIKIVPDATVSLFYLVPILTDKENNYHLVESVHNSYIDVDTWGKISAELSSEEFKITVFPPMGIAETIQQSTYIIQDVEFDEFFNEYSADEDTEIGYIQLAEDPNEYIVLFFSEEDECLNQFYHYGTQGDAAAFVSLLVEKCIKNNNKTLFSFEEKIDMNTLEEWRKSEGQISISNLLKNANAIDLAESYRMSMINNPISDPEMDDYPKKRTIH